MDGSWGVVEDHRGLRTWSMGPNRRTSKLHKLELHGTKFSISRILWNGRVKGG